MLLLFEGIDRSGKTAFAQNLSQRIKFPIYRKTVAANLEWAQYHEYFQGIGYALLELHNRFQFNAIIDRSFMSDWVYSNREADSKPLSIWRDWEKLDTTGKVAVIYLHTPFDDFQKRMAEKPDPYMAVSDYPRFSSLYQQYLEGCRFPVVRVSGVLPLEEQIDLCRRDTVFRHLF